MTTPTSTFETHEVLNQVEPLAGYNVFDEDRALVEGVAREGGAWITDRARALGALAGGEAMAWGFDANRFPPILHTHDRVGRRIDEVELHPAWHALMKASVENELHALPWRRPLEARGAFVARAALGLVFSQVESGHGCPITMTFAAVPAIRIHPEMAAEWEPRFTSTEYDPRSIPASEKRGALCGMAMTEKQGGSDVRANTTRARAMGGARGSGAEYELTGHKWFCSAPMCDAFLVLAQADGGLSCFLLPRFRPDGTRNAIRIQRLKDKLGNRSNPSSEIELQGAWARMLGDEGRGVPTILEMVTHTRLDCVMGSAALMRQAVAQATYYASRRMTFGRRLVEQPLMQNVLADLAIESEAATTLLLRLARAYDAGADASERRFARLATAIAKYWVCKRAIVHVGEALECLGGNGFVEESIFPRLFRESPLNSIWEGSGNVICLDVLRALKKDPGAAEVLVAELARARSGDRRLDAFVDALARDLTADPASLELRARHVVERLAVALQAALLVEHAPAAVSDAFVASRIAGGSGRCFGTLPASVDVGAIVERARPQV